MPKKIYLTPKEQEVYEGVKAADVISHDEIVGLFPQEKWINRTIHGLISKGKLKAIRRGLYFVGGEDGTLKNPYAVSMRIFRGYVGLSSAFKIHGLLDYEPFTVFIITSKRSERRTIGNYSFRAINFGDRATGEEFREGVYVSTVAKTFFDCFFRPSYVGYSEITKALYQLTEMDWDEFLHYFVRFASPSLSQRTGYVLDMMRRETGKDVPERVISYFRKRIKTKTRLLPSYRKGGQYCREWKVMDNLGKKNFLSWWYDG
jgi:predicted transcriptional regulator of viral defense system